MKIHLRKGMTPRQGHTNIPEGKYEDEHGRDGFFGRVSHLYHENPPTNWKVIEGECVPRALDTRKLTDEHNPVCFLMNDDIKFHSWRPTRAYPWYYRNADGDLLYFVHRGNGIVESDYGPLAYEKGDYIVVPKGTTHRVVPSGPSKFLMIEGKGEFEPPTKGILGHYAIYDPALIEIPEPKAMDGEEGQEYEVRVKRNGRWTRIVYEFHPLDVVGWKGDLFMYKLKMRDIKPVMSHRVHLPPSVHTTFVNRNFVVCSFVPRPTESDPAAQRVPFWHRNIDYDEVIFYHEGNFFSREGIDVEMVTWHPYGVHHGPHPGAHEHQFEKEFLEEYAVMVDTRNPLQLTEEGRNIEWLEYWKTWQIKSNLGSS